MIWTLREGGGEKLQRKNCKRNNLRGNRDLPELYYLTK